MKYEIIIIGGGHAGIEASNFLIRKKINFLLVTENINKIGKMSCNPSIGGIGKSHIVKEIDSMGGVMGFHADISGINFKNLNTSKGLAVQSTRIQTDKNIYSYFCKSIFFKKNNLLEGEVKKIIIKKNKIRGIILKGGKKIFCDVVILTTGTFMNSKIYRGEKYLNVDSERNKSKTSLSEQLKYYIKIKKFKTGTPPRLMKESIDYKKLIIQNSDFPLPFFSLRKKKKKYNKYYKNIFISKCYSTKTNFYTNNLIFENINKSSMYSGIIKSKGPRYCPSLEDKIYKFSSKLVNIFLERESLYTNYIYPTGLSNSFPKKIQKKIIRSIKGLKNVKILSYGYAIEYDYLDPKYLKINLESKIISGLFIAGQINGTTGYEEAAAQGLIAGINSYNKIMNLKPIILKKESSYIGVLLNDITTKKIIEPYRMFTSRSENRLYNREDNSIIRIYKYNTNYYNNEESIKIKNFIKNIKKLIYFLKNRYLFFKKRREIYLSVRDKYIGYMFLKKIGIKIKYIKILLGEIIYKQYIKIEKNRNKKTKKIFKKKINISNINFNNIKSLSKEVIYNIKINKPKYIEDLRKITGINLNNIFEIVKYIYENKSIK
ncbi:tRNA uridine-5-carboxymethylaminomethyl(34) synthesis enzyme MnmG [Candidatus Vidania fulgoroideae]|uniref:tRNA uridine 5-carboxymethylaminomethyl modification enzyme MnmG n=1 Tax=Candidatus Vidania fulgoroideorum TaxID=881286 RepID=A0AAX3N954_9PROT|nr:tRNA uridine-5-carboxymethylaminomethyl(34) synthesis enzyme MnmG [Candidatus Vidania fulgoroideae]